MLPTSAGVEPVTSWSPVRRRIQLSHRGRQRQGMSGFSRTRVKDAYACLWQDCAEPDFCLCWGLMICQPMVGHFVSLPREREKRDRRDSRGDEREDRGKKRKMNGEETEGMLWNSGRFPTLVIILLLSINLSYVFLLSYLSFFPLAVWWRQVWLYSTEDISLLLLFSELTGRFLCLVCC